MDLLALYQGAYRKMNSKLLKEVYPSLPSETEESLNDQFKGCKAYDVTFMDMEVSLVDATRATVTVQTTYICTPRTRQRLPSKAVPDVFKLRKFGGAWLIDSMGMMDTNRRRG
jgi:hypothetical protein